MAGNQPPPPKGQSLEKPRLSIEAYSIPQTCTDSSDESQSSDGSSTPTSWDDSDQSSPGWSPPASPPTTPPPTPRENVSIADPQPLPTPSKPPPLDPPPQEGPRTTPTGAIVGLAFDVAGRWCPTGSGHGLHVPAACEQASRAAPAGSAALASPSPHGPAPRHPPTPLAETAEAEEGGAVAPSPLSEVPPDVLARVGRHLRGADVANLGLSCRALREAVAGNEQLWGEKFRARWPRGAAVLPGRPLLCWRAAYRRRVLQSHRLLFQDPLERQWLTSDRGVPNPISWISHVELQWGEPSPAYPATSNSAGGRAARSAAGGVGWWDDPRRFEAEGAPVVLSVQGPHLAASAPFAEPPEEEGLGVWAEVPSETVTADSAANTARITCVATVESSLGATTRWAYVTGSADKTIKMWAGGRLQRTLRGHSEAVTALALVGSPSPFSANPRVLVSASEDKTLRVWGLAPLVPAPDKRPCLGVLRGHGDGATCLLPAPFSTHHVLSGSRDCKVKLWDVRLAGAVMGGGSSALSPLVGTVKLPAAVTAFHQVGGAGGQEVLAVAGSSVCVVDLRSMRAEATVAAHAAPTALLCSAALACPAVPSPLVCTGASDGSACLWDVRMSGGTAAGPAARGGGAGRGPAAVHRMKTNAGRVSSVCVDRHKVVTATNTSTTAAINFPVKVFSTATGDKLTELGSVARDAPRPVNRRKREEWEAALAAGVTALAVRGPFLVAGNAAGQLVSRDFRDCVEPFSEWEPGDLEDAAAASAAMPCHLADSTDQSVDRASKSKFWAYEGTGEADSEED